MGNVEFWDPAEKRSRPAHTIYNIYVFVVSTRYMHMHYAYIYWYCKYRRTFLSFFALWNVDLRDPAAQEDEEQTSSHCMLLYACLKRSTGHTHTHTPIENNTPDTHAHDKNTTSNHQTNTSHKHSTTLESGATTVRVNIYIHRLMFHDDGVYTTTFKNLLIYRHWETSSFKTQPKKTGKPAHPLYNICIYTHVWIYIRA